MLALAAETHLMSSVDSSLWFAPFYFQCDWHIINILITKSFYTPNNEELVVTRDCLLDLLTSPNSIWTHCEDRKHKPSYICFVFFCNVKQSLSHDYQLVFHCCTPFGHIAVNVLLVLEKFWWQMRRECVWHVKVAISFLLSLPSTVSYIHLQC